MVRRTITPHKGGRTTALYIRVTPGFKETLEAAAKLQNMSVADYIIETMEDEMNDNERLNEINRLRELANTITYYGEGTADELVSFYASQNPDEWNSLDRHDQNLLRRFVSEII